jgi:hypothetical protein
MGITHISWRYDSAGRRHGCNLASIFHIVFCMGCVCELLHNFLYDIEYRICGHTEASSSTCSSKASPFHKLFLCLLFRICISPKHLPYTGNFHNDTFSGICAYSPFPFRKHYHILEQLCHKRLVVSRKFFRMDMAEVDCKWLGIFCTNPCDSFIHMCVCRNSAFLDRSIRKDDLLVSMNLCEDSIRYCNCVDHKSVVFCKCCHISKFICGCGLCNTQFSSLLMHKGSFG